MSPIAVVPTQPEETGEADILRCEVTSKGVKLMLRSGAIINITPDDSGELRVNFEGLTDSLLQVSEMPAWERLRIYFNHPKS
jgi:hypothetical protein